jgi:hypothetical protein
LEPHSASGRNLIATAYAKQSAISEYAFYVIKIFGFLDINIEDFRFERKTGLVEIENLNIDIQKSENLYYRLRIPKLLIAGVSRVTQAID